MIINHNMASLNTYNKLSANTSATAKSLEKLSSGLRINKAGDDAAGLAISEKMRGQIRGLDQASRNSQDAISLIQTAEGSLSETHSILQRMRELATQAASDTNVGQDRGEMQKELNQLTSEINRIGNTTEFNTQKLLNGGTGTTSQIRYSVATAGVAQAPAVGTAGAVTSVRDSVKAGTAAVGAVTQTGTSVVGASAVGQLSNMYTNTTSVKAGTGEVALFRTETASVKAATAGAIGTPAFATEIASSVGGTAAATGMTEITIAGAGAVTNAQTATGVDASTPVIAGKDNYQITTNFSNNATFTVGTVVFTAKTSGASGANEFNIGGTIADSVTNLTAKLSASADAALTPYTFVASAGDTITATDATPLTQNNLGIAAIAGGGVVANTATAAAAVGGPAVAGVNTYKLTANFGEGQTFAVGGQTFTAKQSGAVAANGEFNIGATLIATADNLSATMTANATINAKYTMTGVGTDTITATEKSTADGTATNLGAGVVAGSTKGAYGFEIKSNFTAGDQITIAGQTFTAKTAGTANNAAGEFDVGATIADTVTELTKALAGTNGTIKTNYDISSTNVDWPGGGLDGSLVVLTAKNAGVDAFKATANVDPVATKIAAQFGVYKFEIKTNYEAGQKLTIGGRDFTAVASGGVGNTKNTFEIGADVGVTATNLVASLGLAKAEGAGLAPGLQNYTITQHTVAGIYADTLKFTEAVTKTGVAMTTPTQIDVTAVQGIYSFEMKTNFTAGDKINIDGNDFTTGAGANSATNIQIGLTEAATAANVAAAINLSSLNTHYDAVAAVGSNGSNLIRLTEKNGQADGVDTGVSPVVTKTAATLGNSDFTMTKNFAAGEKVTIGGQEFVAVAGARTAGSNEFKVGAAITDTVASLRTALEDKIGTHYTVTDNLAGKLTLVEQTGQATATAPTISAISGVGESRGEFKFQLTTNASAGDKITIAGKEFVAKPSGEALSTGVVANTATTAVAVSAGVDNYKITTQFAAGDTFKVGGQTFTAGAGAGANDFAVGASIDQSVANLQAKMVANGALNANYTITKSGDTITATETNTVDGTATNLGAAVIGGASTGVVANTQTIGVGVATAGVDNYKVATNFVAGDTFKVGTQTFTAGDGTGANDFAVGADAATSVTNLQAKMAANTTLNATYTITKSGDTITATDATPADANNLGAAVIGSTGRFNAGATVDATMDNLVKAINDDTTSFRFSATKLTDNADPLNPVYTLSIKEDGGVTTGDNAVAATATPVAESQGIYRFDLTNNLVAKEKITIEGKTLVAGTDFAVGADASTTAQNIAGSIAANGGTLATRLTAQAIGTSVIFSEAATKATGVALGNPTITGDATAGSFQFSMNALSAGSTVKVDGIDLTIKTGGTEIETAAEVKSLIDNDSTLKTKYEVAVSGSSVTLTQKAGAESASNAALSFATKAGSGFTAQLQIGANTGQSMVLDVKDMRSKALAISEATSRVGQTVEVDGKQYGVAWTASSTVTNGSDSVANEFALDISTNDNATAAVKIIDTAINAVSSERAKMGAYQNRLEHTIANLGTSSENMTSAESRIRDVDMAKEMMQFQKNNILAQAATAMLAQANQQPQGVLQLLR